MLVALELLPPMDQDRSARRASRPEWWSPRRLAFEPPSARQAAQAGRQSPARMQTHESSASTFSTRPAPAGDKIPCRRPPYQIGLVGCHGSATVAWVW